MAPESAGASGKGKGERGGKGGKLFSLKVGCDEERGKDCDGLTEGGGEGGVRLR